MSNLTADASGHLPDFWTISGRVTDATNGKPLAHFQVTPGNEVFLSLIKLEETSRTTGVDGAYALRLNKRFSLPVFKVEAPGYLPALITPPQEDRTDFDLTLQPGARSDIAADGAFRFEDVDSGDYGLSVSRERKIQVHRGMEIHAMMLGWNKISGPVATGDDKINTSDVGTVEVNLGGKFPDRPS